MTTTYKYRYNKDDIEEYTKKNIDETLHKIDEYIKKRKIKSISLKFNTKDIDSINFIASHHDYAFELHVGKNFDMVDFGIEPKKMFKKTNFEKKTLYIIENSSIDTDISDSCSTCMYIYCDKCDIIYEYIDSYGDSCEKYAKIYNHCCKCKKNQMNEHIFQPNVGYEEYMHEKGKYVHCCSCDNAWINEIKGECMKKNNGNEIITSYETTYNKSCPECRKKRIWTCFARNKSKNRFKDAFEIWNIMTTTALFL